MSRPPKKPRRLRRLVFRVILLALVALAVYVPLRHHQQRRVAARLERTRDALREELARLLKDDPRLSGAPPGGVLIGAPAAFTARLAHQVAGGLLERTEIRLTNLRVRKRGTVRVKTFLGRRQLGDYGLDVRLRDVRGRLGAEELEIRYEDDLAHVKVPVTIREGEGRATIRFEWKSKGLGGLACGDVDVTQKVSGRVVPHTYRVEGSVQLQLEEGVVTAVPQLPNLEIRLYVEPSKASWAAIKRLLDSQGLRCRTVLKLVDVPKALKGVLDKGFKVKFRSRILKPIRLPAGFHDSVTLGGTSFALSVEPRGLEAVEDILWYGADLTAQARPPVDEAAPFELPAASPVPMPPEPSPAAEASPPTTPTPSPSAEG